ncbi:MAG: DNA polymerase III subunit delta, partial [Calditrichaeota bacterium]
YCQQPVPEIFLVLVASQSRLASKLQPLTQFCVPVAVHSPRGAELVAFVREEFRRYGKEVDDAAIHMLIHYVGDHTHDLQMEIAQICNYFQDNPSIRVQEVEQIAGIYGHHSVFDFARWVAEGQKEKALFALRTLLEKGEKPQTILYFLLRHFTILWKMHGWRMSGVRDDHEIQKKLNLYRSHYEEYKKQLSKWPRHKIHRVLQLLRQTDEQLRGRRVSPDLFLDLFILQILN